MASSQVTSQADPGSAPEPTLPSVIPPLRAHTAVVPIGIDRIRIGGGPTDSLILDLGPGVDIERLTRLLQWLERPRSRSTVVRRARAAGLSPSDMNEIVTRLVEAGQMIGTDPADAEDSRTRLTLHIHGDGPISDQLTTSLRAARMRMDSAEKATLVVLADHLVPDPRIVSALMSARTAHLQVRVRDGVGLVGPLVLPGLSSCLRCADHHRTSLEPDWPHVATALVGRPGHASPAIIRATAALAHQHIDDLALGLSDRSALAHNGGIPPLLDHVLELYPRPTRLERRRWPAHRLCSCRLHHEEGPGKGPPTMGVLYSGAGKGC